MPTQGAMSISPGGLVSGWAANVPDTDGTLAKMNTRQTIAVLADGVLLARVLCNQHNTGSVGSGYDAEHGFTYQLPSSLLDGVTSHTIALAGYDGIFASQSGPLS